MVNSTSLFKLCWWPERCAESCNKLGNQVTAVSNPARDVIRRNYSIYLCFTWHQPENCTTARSSSIKFTLTLSSESIIFLSCHYTVCSLLRVPVPSSTEMWVVFHAYSSSLVLKEILILGKTLLGSLMKWMENAFSLHSYGFVLPNTRARMHARTSTQKGSIGYRWVDYLLVWLDYLLVYLTSSN